jgi:hypothetical protein
VVKLEQNAGTSDPVRKDSLKKLILKILFCTIDILSIIVRTPAKISKLNGNF